MSNDTVPTNLSTDEDILCDLHDLGFHGKDLAHLEKLVAYIQNYASTYQQPELARDKTGVRQDAATDNEGHLLCYNCGAMMWRIEDRWQCVTPGCGYSQATDLASENQTPAKASSK